jgi:outer membrane protein assembly factor BamB
MVYNPFRQNGKKKKERSMRTITLFTFLVLSLFLLAGCSGSTTGTPASSSRTSTAAASPTLDPNAPAPLSVYVTQGGITALNAANGTMRWNSGIQGQMLAPPVLLDGTLYGGTTLGYVAAFRASDGKTLWTIHADGSILAPVVALNDALYVATATSITALKRADGSLLWRTPVSIGGFGIHLFAVDGTIFAGPDGPESPSGMLALNASDGSVRWRYQVGQNAAVLRAVTDGNVYVEEPLQLFYGGVTENIVHVLNPNDGKERWRFAKTHQRSDIVAQGQGIIYLFTYGSTSPGSTTTTTNLLSALNSSDGALRWATTLQLDQIGQWFIVNTTLHLDTATGIIYQVGTTDGTLHQIHSGSTSPITTDNVMLASGQVVYGRLAPQGGLVAFAAGDWSLKWSYATADNMGITSVLNGIVYGGTANPSTSSTQTPNYVYALKEGAQTLLWRYPVGVSPLTLTIG